MTVSNTVCFIHFFTHTPNRTGNYRILQMLKWREIRSIVQDHIVYRCQSWDYNQEVWATKPVSSLSLIWIACVFVCMLKLAAIYIYIYYWGIIDIHFYEGFTRKTMCLSHSPLLSIPSPTPYCSNFPSV